MGKTEKLIGLALAGTTAASLILAGTAFASEPAAPCRAAEVELFTNEAGQQGPVKGSGLFFGTLAEDGECTLTGYVQDVRLLDAGKRPIPAVATRDTSQPVRVAQVSHGPGAEVGLTWADGPTVPAYLEVRLPGADETSVVDWKGGGIDPAQPLFFTAVQPTHA
ncbi:DUF4232 domain-containing protein [Amycolatopsis thailandensis]|uniref:DUF4232 domain-containing protein n=1 Tax=Amycolatopsis thailandensis TaxID=589330 RepID=UPI0037B19A1D